MSDYIEYYDKVEALNKHNLESLNELIIYNNPGWLNPLGIIESFEELASIYEGGCASGAYMPAVTYYTAREAVLSNDSISEYAIDKLEEMGCFEGLAEAAKQGVSSYCAYLCSVAVEAWVSEVMDEVLECIDTLLQEQSTLDRFEVSVSYFEDINTTLNSNDPSSTSKLVSSPYFQLDDTAIFDYQHIESFTFQNHENDNETYTINVDNLADAIEQLKDESGYHDTEEEL